MRAKTLSAGLPSERPERTRLARRSILQSAPGCDQDLVWWRVEARWINRSTALAASAKVAQGSRFRLHSLVFERFDAIPKRIGGPGLVAGPRMLQGLEQEYDYCGLEHQERCAAQPTRRL